MTHFLSLILPHSALHYHQTHNLNIPCQYTLQYGCYFIHIYICSIYVPQFSPSQSFDIFKDPSSQFNLHYASVDRLILLLFQAASTTSCHKSTCLHCLERAVQCRLDWDSSCVGFAGEPSHLSACYPAAALVLYEPIYSARSAL